MHFVCVCGGGGGGVVCAYTMRGVKSCVSFQQEQILSSRANFIIKQVSDQFYDNAITMPHVESLCPLQNKSKFYDKAAI